MPHYLILTNIAKLLYSRQLHFVYSEVKLERRLVLLFRLWIPVDDNNPDELKQAKRSLSAEVGIVMSETVRMLHCHEKKALYDGWILENPACGALLERAKVSCSLVSGSKHLRALSTDTTCQLNVLGHDRHTLGVDSAQVGIFEQTNEVGFRGFLERKDGRSLKAKIGLEILSNLANETLEGELADQQVRGLLVATDLAKSDGSGAVTVGLLDSTRGRSGLASSLGRELLTGSLASGGFTSGLLGAGHLECFCYYYGCKLYCVEDVLLSRGGPE